MKSTGFAFVVLLSVAASAIAITKEQVDAIVKPAAEVARLDRVAVGVIDANGRAVYGYGKNSTDGKTVFEIGSISKVFTASLLAEMVQRGEVKLNQPVRELLPAGVKVPAKDGMEITLVHLSDQTSGLPRLPTDLDPADITNPYVDYTPAKLYESLALIKLTRKPGEAFDYSNLGVGLLGHALSLKGERSFEALLIERICKPLGMNDTTVTLRNDQRARLAKGHDAVGFELPNWDFDALASAGGIRSTADDMLIFLAANLQMIDAPVAKALAMTHARRAATDEDGDIGMNWFIGTRTGARWHDGMTGGYASFAAFVPDKKVGVVVLCNTAGGMVDTIGRQLIQAMLGEEVEPIQPTTAATR